MKLVMDRILVPFILFINLGFDVTCSQLIEYSGNSALSIAEYKNSSFSTTLLISTTTQSPKKHKPLKRRKRIRIKKKKPGLVQTTLVSTPSTILPPIKYIKETPITNKKQKTRKLKKRRKNKRKNHNSSVITTTSPRPSKVLLLESENLFFPITQTTIISKLKTALKPTHRKRKIITRCSKNNGGCSHICHIKGPEKCSCFTGFSLASDHHICLDNNECSINNGGCQINCTNTVGSFHCHCPHGLRLAIDSKSCEDVNECVLRNGHGPCQDRCENTYGGYKCNCNSFKGSKLGNDFHTCFDIDECAEDNGGCSHICINTFGKSFCSCPEGMELSPDFKNCQDINECENEIIKTNCPNGCINTEGSYRCANMQDLQNDESYHKIVCNPLFPPQNGFFKCSRKHAVKTFTKTGRARIKNSLGTKCILVCPEGFKRKGNGYRVSCGYGGQWIGKMDAKCVPI